MCCLSQTSMVSYLPSPLPPLSLTFSHPALSPPHCLGLSRTCLMCTLSCPMPSQTCLTCTLSHPVPSHLHHLTHTILCTPSHAPSLTPHCLSCTISPMPSHTCHLKPTLHAPSPTP